MTKKVLPLRIGVGAILLNNENKIFVGKRKDNPVDKWQMPQGGIDTGESPISAAYRELYEETGCQSVELVGQTTDWILYDLPQALVKKSWGGKFRGQAQKWFVFHFKGDDKEFDLAKTEKPEFLEWKWVDLDIITEVVVDFKLHVYKELKEKIKKIIN